MQNDKQILIFGAGAMGELMHHYFSTQGRKIAAFVVTSEYLTKKPFHGLPLVDINCVVDKYPPNKFTIFVAINYINMNKLREKICNECLSLGYTLESYIHPSAITPGSFELAQNTVILEQVVIEPYSTIGSNCVLFAGTTIAHHVSVMDNCFFAPGVTCAGLTNIGRNCFLGTGANIGSNITIGSHSIIGAGAVVTSPLPKKSIITARHDLIWDKTTDQVNPLD